jgi:hypothetical protein
MRVRFDWRLIVFSAVFLALVNPACSDPNAFQPIATGAQPWTPPAGFAPMSQCSVGYYIAIDSCPGCADVSYALCNGDKFNQCICGTAYTPGTICPNQIHCPDNDWPPQGWFEFTDYMGPGWYVFDHMNAGTGSSSGTSSGSAPEAGTD